MSDGADIYFVIASEAKQSIGLDCRVAALLAMTKTDQPSITTLLPGLVNS
jgi:hypothetical protein